MVRISDVILTSQTSVRRVRESIWKKRALLRKATNKVNPAMGLKLCKKYHSIRCFIVIPNTTIEM